MPKLDLRPLLTTTDLAKRWSMTKESLENWRVKKIGPAYLKIGSKVLYKPEVIEAWEAKNSKLG